ncbi:MAG: hypothetical protein WA421_18800 [Nitrososphaeraceae archaeon]
MNNATTIRALAAIVMVVVLIFTTGTLAAATSSSFAPQPQNLTCTHPDNNASCSQEGIISTTQISLPLLQPQSSATLTNIKHVINDIVGTVFAKDFTSSASDSNVSPQSSFPGAQSPGTFPAVLSQQANATTTTAVVVVAAADHNKCSSDDIITCTPKETHHPAKDTTPFDLPLPFP